MRREIINPHWTNNARTILGAEFKYANGNTVKAVISASDSNPDYNEILTNYGDVLEANTLKNMGLVKQEEERLKQQQQANTEKKAQEDLFATKIKAFEIDAVINSENREMKAKIRRAKTDVEVMAYTSALIVLEAQQQ